MCDSIYCAYILVILCIVLYMFFYEANKDDYYKEAPIGTFQSGIFNALILITQKRYFTLDAKACDLSLWVHTQNLYINIILYCLNHDSDPRPSNLQFFFVNLSFRSLKQSSSIQCLFTVTCSVPSP